MKDTEYEKMISIVNQTFPLKLKKDTLDFLLFLKDSGTESERLYGYWKNKFYWMVSYQKECVCYILFNGYGEERQFAPLTVWTDDSDSACYENVLLRKELKRIALNHIDYCLNCGSCSGGTDRMLFGESYPSVCRTAMRFINPNQADFQLLKMILKERMKYIENQKNID